MIPYERLKQIPLFAKVSDEHLALIAPLFTLERHHIGEVLCRQGAPGDAFYVVQSGRLRVRHVDSRNRERVLDYIEPPSAFGEVALLVGLQYEATTDVFSEEAEMYVLPKRELDELLNDQTTLLDSLTLDPEVKKKLDAHRMFPWLLADEIVAVSTRRHKFALVMMLRIPILVTLVLAIAATIAMFIQPGIGIFLWVVFGLWGAGAGIWCVLDWSNDHYVVTNRRVVHIEKVIAILDSREEAPLEQVTNVLEQVDGIAARLFGYSEIHVETSGHTSDIDFTYAPNQQRIRATIFEQIERIRSRLAAERRERLRAGIREDLIERLDPDVHRQMQERTAKRPASSTTKRSQFAQWFDVHFGMRVEQENQITWRKHWSHLARRAGAPFLICAMIVGTGILHLARVIPLNLVAPGDWQMLGIVLIAGILGLLAAGFVTWYQYEDWRNDIYAVTEDRLVDSERTPFGFHQRSVETTLDRVQDITFLKPNILATWLDYGDLKIETGGAQGQLIFTSIAQPQKASQEIFRRRATHRARKEQLDAKEQRAQVLDWFMEYSRFLQERHAVGDWTRRAGNNPSAEAGSPPASESEGGSPAS
ncbi:MAG: cyclic nucleotide-binding domain-containing protein [Chloroflexi bacterium]|nr:cyclic nucleotide-binding domain-containing protein [Chloroflexota bacterium]